MTTLRLSIEETLPSQNVLLRMHWAKRGRVRRRVAWMLMAELLKHKRPMSSTPIQRCNVRILRYAKQAPDGDNLPSSAKLILDVLQPLSKRHPDGLGVIENNSADCIIEFKIEHADGKNRTDIEIEELPP